jgi:hypothetical protein
VVSGARWLALSAFALAALLAAPLHAETDREERARLLFREGVSLAKQERWTDALEKFEASRDLVERASTLFNIGTTLMRLTRPRAAIATFEQFLALEEQKERRKAAQDLIEQARSTLATIELTIEPRNARLSVDGEAIPPNGPVRSVRLDPGRRTIEVSAEGFGPLRETIALEPGSRVSRTIELQPIDAAPPPPPALAEAELVDPVAPPPPPPLAPTVVEGEPQEESSILESPWLWIVVGAVVVAAAVGVGVGVSRRGTEEPFGGSTGDVLELP